MKKYMVDARGKQCPIPVVETKKMLAQMAIHTLPSFSS